VAIAQDTRPSGDHPERIILLVDDDAMIRNALRRILERAGFTVLVAEDGREAIRIAREHVEDIDLLISDVQMPHMTGLGLAMGLKSAHPELRVLLVSADPQHAVILDPGWNFLQKPFRSSVLINKVREILSDPRGK
jgi:two-component system cell cycle sensor histidine kinase/response regulator CckA